MEIRLRPINAVLDLGLADGLNPAPLADAGWQIACLEIPVRTESGTVVCDVVLFNPGLGRLLVVEAKSGANIEGEQARRLAAIDPQALIIAGGITVPQAVRLTCEPIFACLTEHAARITKGVSAAGLTMPVLSIGPQDVRLANPEMASPELAAALSGTVTWTHPVARIIPFDHESPAQRSRVLSVPSWLPKWPGTGLPSPAEPLPRRFAHISPSTAGKRKVSYHERLPTPLGRRRRMSRSGFDSSGPPERPTSGLLSCAHLRSSTRAVERRATRPCSAAVDVGSLSRRCPASWTCSPNSIRRRVCRRTKQARMSVPMTMLGTEVRADDQPL